MKIYITSFANLRWFTPNIIPISTALGWPWWLYKDSGYKQGEYFVNKQNIMIGIREETFACEDLYNSLTEKCQKDCPYKNKVPNCQFMEMYYNHLCTLNFNATIKDWERVAEDVRKITHFEGEPIICLLVYEAANCPCAERPCIQHWFRDNNYKLLEWSRDLI